jgi:ATP-dependent Lhr-like helicase
MGSLDVFRPETRDWFERNFAAPTPAQDKGWPAIAGGGHVLIQAPTGSGKTLAAFLSAIDRLTTEPGKGLRVLYVSPLKALNYDVERNLRGPLAGLRSELRVAVRTGDTPQKERAAMLREPPDILITTPESLFLLLTSRARELLRSVDTLILDEVHAVAGTKRGAHLALSVERLDRLAAQPVQRIGLSATQRPLEEIGRFVSGGREIQLVDAGVAKELDLEVVVPVEDMREPGGESREEGWEPRSIWPSIYPALVELVRAHRSTIVFVNNRRLAERLALRLNELAEEEIARAHHGSLAREQRTQIEEDLKAGRIPCLVATSSLELGIDMGAVDLVIQVESPKSVARGLQRIGRAGHSLGEVSRGRIFPKFRADLLESAVVAQRMREGLIEETQIPRNPLDVLAQHVVAITADEEIEVAELHELVRRAYPFADLSRAQLENVLDMLAGRYPSDEFAELRPRIVWDRTGGVLRGRPGSRRLAVTNAGTIPDRGLFGVFIAGETGGRVGELDEEMVYEARAGQVIVLGASSWRIEEITRCRARCRSGRARASAARTSSARRSASSRASCSRPGSRRFPTSTSAPSGTSSPSCASRSARPEPCPRTAPSSSSASATRSATGGSASSRRSARACTRPGRWPSARGSASRSASRCSRSGRTTGSRSTCPTPTRHPRPTCSCSTRTSSRIWCSPRWGRRRSSARGSGRTPRGRCSSRGDGPASGRRSGSRG